jgi:hypothetical protein
LVVLALRTVGSAAELRTPVVMMTVEIVRLLGSGIRASVGTATDCSERDQRSQIG